MFRNPPLTNLIRTLKQYLFLLLLISLFFPKANVSANAGNSLYFDGNTDYVYVGETRAVMGGTSWMDTMSFSLWVKPIGMGFCTVADVAQCDSIIGDRPRWWGLSHGTVSGLNRLWVWNYDGNYDKIGISYTEGEWVHIGWVHANGTLKAYKNGELVGSVPSGTTSQPSTGAFPKLQIGAAINNATRNWSFHGEIDEVRIYNSELTQSDIQATLFTELNGSEAGLRAYYKMSDGSGLVLTDDSINSFNGQFKDGIPNVTDGTFPLWITSTAFVKPIARELSLSTIEDTPVEITLLGQGEPGSILTYTATNPLNGSINIVDSNLTYTPAQNFLGVESFTYQAWINGIASSPATIRITVSSSNDAPIANNQNLELNEDSSINGTLLASDLDGDPLTYSITAQPTHGILTGTLPNFAYTPNPNYYGSDSFSFKANDTHIDSNIATITLTIQPVNDVPSADTKEFTTQMGVAIPITLTGSDVENSPLTFTVVANPSNGILSGSSPNLVYTPNGGYSGSDSFTYTSNDTLATSLAATVTINITALNQTPIANNQTVSTNEDIDIPITLTGSDPESQPITYTILTQPSHGTLIGTAPSITYHPNSNYFGSDSFTFKVRDDVADSNIATVIITVNSVNDAPVANNLQVNTSVNQSTAFVLSGSDVENNPLTFVVITNPQHGSLTGNIPNLTYTPLSNYSGSDSFTYKTNDGSVDSVVATVNVTITSTNLPPVANSQDITMAEDTTIPITLTGSDPEGSPLTFSFLTPTSHASFFGTPPNMTYDPYDNFFGTDYFIFRVWDGVQWSQPATVNIVVTAVNDAPRALSQTVQTPKNVFVDIQLTGTDVDGDLVTLTIFSSPINGTLGVIDPLTKIVRYTPNPNYTGTDYFRITATDGNLTSRPATISLTIIN
ncbi:MAG: hypothetical protein CVU46_11945 [Chloroflexi bacterium HGW-Chloroflexi-8]|nr:MAG: hypothetical protein CVU46_11945 [Chloroflexi bacterium HGW-Chloroflexi-8]